MKTPKINIKPKNLAIFGAAGIVLLLLALNPIPLVEAKTPVYQLLSDYQNLPNGGDGWIRLMTFNPAENKIYVQTYSPFLNKYQTDENSRFTLAYNMTNIPEGSLQPVPAPFTIVVFPDTQYYSAHYPEIFTNLTHWVILNRVELNIVFVIHLGDIVDNPLESHQWYNSKASMSILSNYNVPYSVLPGNHDFFPFAKRKTSYYYLLYGPHVFENTAYYGGSYNDDNYNNYELLDVANLQFLILNLQYNPTPEMEQWANGIIKQYPERKVILSTHEYVGVLGRTPIGESIWNNVVKPNVPQCQIVLCGHFYGEYQFMGSIVNEEHEALRVDLV